MDVLLWIVGALVLLLVLFVVIGVVIGGTLPQDHVAMRTASFSRPAEAIWAAINDASIMEARGQGMGKTELVESVPPRLLVRRIVGERDYGGTWTCEIAPTAEGCTLTITENGYVYNRFFRFMSRYVIGHYRSIDGVLRRVRER